MTYEKQRRLRDELNACFPRLRSNIGQQMFRSCYFNARMHGDTVDAAISTAVKVVREAVPGFAQIAA